MSMMLRLLEKIPLLERQQIKEQGTVHNRKS